jgi:spermidine synthase
MQAIGTFLHSMVPQLALRDRLRVLGLLFITTGFAGLLAEQSFEKLLSTLLGATTPAAAVVLAVYFLGLTCGALLFSRWRRWCEDPLRLYAWLEAGIAVWSLLLLVGSGPLTLALVPLLRLGAGDFLMLQVLRGVVVCLWILPPTLAMGATFPAIVEVLRTLRVPQPQRAMSRFYSLNLLGAILGALAGPYLVFSHMGLSGALGLTFVLDFAVALVAFGLSLSHPARRRQGLQTSVSASATPLAGQGTLLVLAFASGFLFFGLEVVWTQLIAAVLGNSVYAFAAMLTLVLTGLGIGGVGSVVFFKDRKPATPTALAILLLAGGFTLAWQHRQWPEVPLDLMVWGGNLTTFRQGEFLRWVQAARLLLPPSIAFGMVYPTLFRLNGFSGEGRALLAARVGATNAVGCVLGALLTGFILIPGLGSEGSLMLFGFLAATTVLVMNFTFSEGHNRWVLLVLGLGLGVVWGTQPAWNRLALTSGGHVYFQTSHVLPTSKLLFFHEDTLGGITTVVANAAPGPGPAPVTRTLLTNGKFQANDAGEVHAQTAFALVPILHQPRFDQALVIGLGSGHSAEVVHQLGFGQVDIAEIAPDIVTAARTLFPHINGRVLEQPNVRLILEDGRNHLLLSSRRYDLITMEISSIWFAGSTSLYSREFYRLAKAHLTEGGILQQWIQIHHIGTEELGSVIRTVREVFPEVEFWVVGGQGILIASEHPLTLRPAACQRVLQRNPWNDATPESQQQRLEALLKGRLLAAREVEHLLARTDFPVNTDANRYLEYASPKYNLSREPHEQINIQALGRFATFPGFPEHPELPPLFQQILARQDPLALAKGLGLDGPRPPLALK